MLSDERCFFCDYQVNELDQKREYGRARTGQASCDDLMRSKDNNVVVTTEHTDVGICPQRLDRIFEAFLNMKDEIKSVGLGLVICHELIREQGRRIDAVSDVGKAPFHDLG